METVEWCEVAGKYAVCFDPTDKVYVVVFVHGLKHETHVYYPKRKAVATTATVLQPVVGFESQKLAERFLNDLLTEKQ